MPVNSGKTKQIKIKSQIQLICFNQIGTWNVQLIFKDYMHKAKWAHSEYFRYSCHLENVG